MAAAEIPEVRAEAKYVRTAPRKAQLVVAEIRGLRVDDARTMLAFMPRAAARDVEAVLKSAVANAEANHGLSGDDLYVSAAYVGYGPTLKRWRARARGRVNRIRKRSCHITIAVRQADDAKRPRKQAAATPVAAQEPTPESKPEPKSAPRAASKPKADVAAAAAAPETTEKPKRVRAPRRKTTEEAES